MVSESTAQLKKRLVQENFKQQLSNAFITSADHKLTPAFDRQLFPANVNYQAYLIGGNRLVAVQSKHIQRHVSLLMLHGGGFVLPAGKNFIQVGMQFVNAGYTVWFADYPLLNRASSQALRHWVLQAYQIMCHQGNPCLLWGDSAGANIALRLLMDLRDQGMTQPLATELFSLGPKLIVNQMTQDRPAGGQELDDIVLDSIKISDLFLNTFDTDMLSLFTFNTTNTYQNLGHIRLDGGAEESFANDIEELGSWLVSAVGTLSEVHIYDGMIHDFVLWPNLPESKMAVKNILRYFQLVQAGE